MKEVFLNRTILFLRKYQDYSEDDMEKLKYGLEGLYLTLTKLIVIIIIAWFLNIFKEVFYILILFNIIRYFGFGVHAKKSIDCLITSSFLFLIIPYFLLHIELSKEVMFYIGVLLIVSYTIFAPADTIKRPLPNTKKKKIRKFMTTLIGIIYLFFSLFISNYQLSVLFFIAMIIQAIVICPITYMLLGQTYNNYKKQDV